MDSTDIEEIDRSATRSWREGSPEIYEKVAHFWQSSVVPTLKATALEDGCAPEQFHERWYRANALTEALFGALHFGWDSGYAPAEERPKGFWLHQSFDILQAGDPKRGFAIDRGSLLAATAEYLSHPEIRTNKLDWVFLDSIIFAELDSFGSHVLNTRAGTGINFAASMAEGNYLKYYLLSTLFWVLGFVLRYVALPALALFLGSRGYESLAWVIAGLWGLNLVWVLIGFPTRWKMRRKGVRLLERLLELYQVVGDSTISPRRLKEVLDKAAADGVVLDGAVFSLVDRLLARDASAFVPSQVG